jgi:peptidoglycan/xylan/chitin deacetylase (PgdA/CDA1 family)
VYKGQIARGLDTAGLLSLVLAVRARTRSPWLPVVTYHRVAPRDRSSLFDDGVIDATPEAFDRQLSSLERWFSVLALEDVFAFRKGKPLPKNPVLLTFDDGYKDCFEAALPILQRHGLKATFFVATDFIEERRLFWWDRINLIVKSSHSERVELSYPTALTLPLVTAPERDAAIRRLCRIVKVERSLDLDRFQDGLSAACGVSLDGRHEREMADALLMTWDEVRALHRAGMDVQSHTRSHRTLQTVPVELLAQELGGSREILEHELGAPVRAISYPLGKGVASAPQIRAAVRAAGYELGFSNATGLNSVQGFDPLDARRLALGVELSDAHFLAMLSIPGFSYTP